MDQDSLLRQISSLQAENQRLRQLLRSAGLVFADNLPATSAPHGAALLRNPAIPSASPTSPQITAARLRLFTSLFRGRTDVYSRRSAHPSPKTGKCGYYAQVDYSSPVKKYLPLTYRDIYHHLLGDRPDCSDVIGIYPLLPDDTCYFLVFDFDNHSEDAYNNLEAEVSALHQMCQEHHVSHLVERSRSGKGYHIWLFFETPIPAATAREFGTALLEKGSDTVSLPSFRTFDRMIPASDHLPVNFKTGQPGIGNMVALPLQGQALKQGNSAFLDASGQPYQDQWAALASVQKLSSAFVAEKISAWARPALMQPSNTTPWQPTPSAAPAFSQADATGPLAITLADKLYIDSTNLHPRLQNQLRALAAFPNPDYFKKLGLGFSTYDTPRIISCGEDIGKYICLPRGLRSELIKNLSAAHIPYGLTDERNPGIPLAVTFTGQLLKEQEAAAEKMLAHEDGILAATTAFGKTVLGAYLIAKLGVNTLILVPSREILNGWQRGLAQFLQFHTDLPVKITPAGRHSHFKSHIGTFRSTRDSTTGLVDIAMVSSLGQPGHIHPLVKKYGLVIMDECHHGPARLADAALREVSSRYLYGLTATPIRCDGFEKKIFMEFGPIRYRFSAKDRARLTGFSYLTLPVTTNFTTAEQSITSIYRALADDSARNQQIITDVLAEVAAGRTPLIATRLKSHAALLYRELKNHLSHVFLLTGGQKSRQAAALVDEMKSLPATTPLALVATGQYVGEGFNFPRLDTLFLATPVSYRGRLEQYAGRIGRSYPGKQTVKIIDYVDSNVPVLLRMYQRRRPTYKNLGYQIQDFR